MGFGTAKNLFIFPLFCCFKKRIPMRWLDIARTLAMATSVSFAWSEDHAVERRIQYIYERVMLAKA